jgi:hypothetical protein
MYLYNDMVFALICIAVVGTTNCPKLACYYDEKDLSVDTHAPCLKLITCYDEASQRIRTLFRLKLRLAFSLPMHVITDFESLICLNCRWKLAPAFFDPPLLAIWQTSSVTVFPFSTFLDKNSQHNSAVIFSQSSLASC